MNSTHSKKDLFDKNGFFVEKNLFNENEIIKWRREINRLHEAADILRKSRTFEDSDFQIEPFLEKSKVKSPILRKIENTQNHSKLFFQLARHESLVSIIKDLLGPDLLLFRSTLMLKPALHGSEHAFHQDGSYWPMDPPNLVTVSIAIDESTVENGCIKVIPESHLSELKNWGNIAKPPDSKSIGPKKANLPNQIEVPLLPGSALFFHSKLIHGSGPNKSNHSRNTALYAYFNPQVRYVPQKGMPHSISFPVIAGLGGAKKFEMTVG